MTITSHTYATHLFSEGPGKGLMHSHYQNNAKVFINTAYYQILSHNKGTCNFYVYAKMLTLKLAEESGMYEIVSFFLIVASSFSYTFLEQVFNNTYWYNLSMPTTPKKHNATIIKKSNKGISLYRFFSFIGIR